MRRHRYCRVYEDLYRDDIGISQQRVLHGYIRRDHGMNITPQEDLPSIPVFLSHRSDDDVIEPELEQQLKEILKSLEMEVELHEYADRGHWIKESEAMGRVCDVS
jgi:predicted esterase